MITINLALQNTILTALGVAFNDCVMEIYASPRAADANAVPTGTLLALITVDGGAFVAGAPGNGLGWESAAAAELLKATAETWKGEGLASGTAYYAVVYNNEYEKTLDSTEDRFMLSVGGPGSGAEVELATTSVVSGVDVVVQSAKLTYPASSS